MMFSTAQVLAKPPLSMNGIVLEVAKHYGVEIANVRGRDRSKHAGLARNLAIYLIRTYIPQPTLENIGAYFGYRSSSSIGHVYLQMAAKVLASRELQELAQTIRQCFGN